VSFSEIPGGAHAAPPAAPTPPLSLLARISALRSLTVAELRAKYEEVFGEPTRSNNREWLFRSVAWQIQALAEGGLSERAKRRAQELARESDVRPRRERPPTPGEPTPAGRTRVITLAPVRDPRAPLPGTLLVREYRGRQIRVRVLDQGFEYEGRTFRSLTAVAEAVTGAHWSGALFFRLRKPSGAKETR
jgi:hypothetical protein